MPNKNTLKEERPDQAQNSEEELKRLVKECKVLNEKLHHNIKDLLKTFDVKLPRLEDKDDYNKSKERDKS